MGRYAQHGIIYFDMASLRLPTKDAAEYYKVSQVTMLSWIKTGKVVAEKIGQKWIVVIPSNNINYESPTTEDLDKSIIKKRVEENLLAALKAKQERLILEGQFEKPEELARREQKAIELESALTIREQESAEKEKANEKAQAKIARKAADLKEREKLIKEYYDLITHDLNALKQYHQAIMNNHNTNIPIPELSISEEFYQSEDDWDLFTAEVVS